MKKLSAFNGFAQQYCFYLVFLAAFSLTTGAWAQENPFEDHPITLSGEATSATDPISIEIPLGKAGTVNVGTADIIETAGQLICMTGNPIGCVISVVAGIVKHKDGTNLEKASTIGDLSPLPGPIGVVGKVVAVANYGRIAYDNKDKIEKIIRDIPDPIETQPPCPVEEREIIPLPAQH